MPKLPVYENERDFEIAQKGAWSRGTIAHTKPIIHRKPIKIPKKPIIILAAVIVLLVGVYLGVRTFAPNLLELGKKPVKVETKAFEFPLDAAQIKYPSNILRDKFLANFQAASNENNEEKRYKFLEDNFLLLRGFYTSTSSSEYRPQLKTYKEYMQKNYAKKVEANSALYNVPCIDKLCGEVKLSDDVKQIRDHVIADKKLNAEVKDAILRNFNAIGVNSDRAFQINMYMATLSMLVSEFNRTNDLGVKKIDQDLAAYVVKTYPEVKIPPGLSL